jgi:hypothetical protein
LKGILSKLEGILSVLEAILLALVGILSSWYGVIRDSLSTICMHILYRHITRILNTVLSKSKLWTSPYSVLTVRPVVEARSVAHRFREDPVVRYLHHRRTCTWQILFLHLQKHGEK